MDDETKRGRPSKYDPAYDEQAEKLCRLGATDVDIADFFKVSESTLYRWKTAQESFREAIKRTKEELDAQVEQSLFRRAMGYSHPAVKFFQAGGEIIKQDYVEHYPPDPTSLIFWLTNRQSAKWRRNNDAGQGDQEAEVTGVTPVVRDGRKPGA